ncbi:GIY-YIG nuclease family protein [Mesoflavibacter zeaxanthinifaciens]|uniref:GIY-YIG nuclease family protein n=1 Tax=Mesoflavibacter zeaxanthinifaciens TaxID=393060 RepID=UPI0026F021EA|nr:hypothetical protein [Mesoflavibacter zeaxanthinifaciens]
MKFASSLRQSKPKSSASKIRYCSYTIPLALITGMKKTKVKEIRTTDLRITNNPIIYYWWFRTDSLKRLLNKLESQVDFDKIKTKFINESEYGLLYIGQAKKGHDRLIKYHILDSNNFHLKGVENGRLSSLRTTLCGLLEFPMSKSKDLINDFMDKNCVVEWEKCELDELNIYEKERIQNNYLPLNYQHTKETLTKEHRKILSKSKKKMRI